MTEKSYFWGSDPGIGDYQSSYTDDELALWMLLLYNYDRTRALISRDIIYSNVDVADVMIGDFRVYACIALVDGRVYENDATITLVPGDGDGYYAVVLRKTEATQEVRAALIYDAIAPPVPTQTNAVWECVIAQGQVIGGVAQIDEQCARPFPHNFVLPLRVGEKDYERNFVKPGTSVYTVDGVAYQAGVAVAPGTTLTIAFPNRWSEGNVPLVFVTAVNYSGGTPAHDHPILVSNVTETGFTITVDDITGIERYNWVAVGLDDFYRY